MENNFTDKCMDEQEKGEMKMAIEIIEEVEEFEQIEDGKTMYTISKDLVVVETTKDFSNPISHDYDALKLFLDNNMNVLEDYFNDEDNYGIAFRECGYNGKAQEEFIQSWLDNGVQLF